MYCGGTLGSLQSGRWQDPEDDHNISKGSTDWSIRFCNFSVHLCVMDKAIWQKLAPVHVTGIDEREEMHSFFSSPYILSMTDFASWCTAWLTFL